MGEILDNIEKIKSGYTPYGITKCVKQQLEQKTKYEQISEDCKKIPFEKVKEMLLTNPKPDMVNHPSHYNVNGFEVIDIIKAFTDGLEGIQAVDTANAIKYILRWHHKNGVEDLKKAKWYIEHLIKEMEDDSN